MPVTVSMPYQPTSAELADPEHIVAFVNQRFDDLGNVEWARKAIEVMASKGIINGTGRIPMHQQTILPRADYLVLLVRTLGLTADFDSNFDDVAPGT